jgi:uncharacterized damage-inducible protein DinB
MATAGAMVQALMAELEHEGAGTRRIIAAVPDEHLDFRPHEKSWTARELIGHLIEIPGWIPETLTLPEWDMAAEDFKLVVHGSVAEALAAWDENMTKALSTLTSTPDEALSQVWSLKSGERVFFELPRAQVMRSFILNHLIHHRAQLGMYLRLLNVPVPALYGNSADDPGLMG